MCAIEVAVVIAGATAVGCVGAYLLGSIVARRLKHHKWWDDDQ